MTLSSWKIGCGRHRWRPSILIEFVRKIASLIIVALSSSGTSGIGSRRMILVFWHRGWCKSTSGCCVYFGHNLISWFSQKQKVVLRSSTKAKYRSIAALLAEIKWLQNLLSKLRLALHTPTIFSDNLGAVLITSNPVMHSRSKHFEIHLHFVWDFVHKKEVQLLHLPAHYQVADILTKPLSSNAFLSFKSKLRVVNNPTLSG